MSVTPDLLAQIASRHAVYMEGLKTGYMRDLTPFLVQMQDDILVQIARISDPSSLSAKRLNAMLRTIKASINEAYGDYNAVWKDQIRELGEYTSGFEAKALEQVVAQPFTTPSPAKIYTAAFAKPLSASGVYEGQLLDAVFATLPQNAYRRIEGAVRLASAQGQSTAKLMQRIRGTRAAKFTDGLMNATRREAELIARTSLAHVNNTAKEVVWQANADVIKEMEFLAVLDGRTSSICRSLSGRKYPVGSGPVPPLHLNCRSTLIAVFDDGLDFLDNTGKQFARGDKGVEYVGGDLTYYDWLKTQNKGFQDSVLGPTRGNLLRNGGLSSERFSVLQLDKNFNALSLDDMRKLEPLAFDRAGI